MAKLPFVLLVFVLALSSMSTAQSTEKPLTNADIIRLKTVGVDDATVIMKIDTSQSAFDTTTGALEELTKKGISGPILRAMMRAGKPKVSPTTDSIDAQFDAIVERLDKPQTGAKVSKPILPSRITKPIEMKESADDFDFILEACKAAGSNSLACTLRVKNTLDVARTLRLGDSTMKDENLNDRLSAEEYLGSKKAGGYSRTVYGSRDEMISGGGTTRATVTFQKLKIMPKSLSLLRISFGSDQGSSFVEFENVPIMR
jgi:hypothetical protein